MFEISVSKDTKYIYIYKGGGSRDGSNTFTSYTKYQENEKVLSRVAW